MKKKPVKNRKIETRNKKIFIVSCVLGLILISASLVVSVYIFLRKAPYLSPSAKMVITQSNNKVSSMLDAQAEIENLLNQNKINYASIDKIDDATYIITIDGDEKVIVDPQTNLAMQIASLQLITSRLTMEGKRFSRLDLRDEKPVITF